MAHLVIAETITIDEKLSGRSDASLKAINKRHLDKQRDHPTMITLPIIHLFAAPQVQFVLYVFQCSSGQRLRVDKWRCSVFTLLRWSKRFNWAQAIAAHIHRRINGGFSLSVSLPLPEITYKVLDSRFLFQYLPLQPASARSRWIGGAWSRELNGALLATRGYRNSLSIIRPRFCTPPPRPLYFDGEGDVIRKLENISSRQKGQLDIPRRCSEIFPVKLLTIVTSLIYRVCAPRFTMAEPTKLSISR